MEEDTGLYDGEYLREEMLIIPKIIMPPVMTAVIKAGGVYIFY